MRRELTRRLRISACDAFFFAVLVLACTGVLMALAAIVGYLVVALAGLAPWLGAGGTMLAVVFSVAFVFGLIGQRHG